MYNILYKYKQKMDSTLYTHSLQMLRSTNGKMTMKLYPVDSTHRDALGYVHISLLSLWKSKMCVLPNGGLEAQSPDNVSGSKKWLKKLTN